MPDLLRDEIDRLRLEIALDGKAGFDENQLRDPHTGEWIDASGPSLDQAADAVASAVLAWLPFQENPDPNPPSRAEIAVNWKKQLDGRLSEDENAHKAVKDAQRQNAANPIWQSILETFPADNVLVVKESSSHTSHLSIGEPDAAARRHGGTSFVNDVDARLQAGTATEHRGEQAPRSAVTLGGLAALLRHEYGHSIDDILDADTKRRLREALPNPSEDLSIYSGKSSAELVPELLAIVTDPSYRPAEWPPSVRKAGRILMEALVR